MSDNTPSEHEEIYASVGRLTMATADIDEALTIIAARLLSDRQAELNLDVPSIIIFSARSFEQREELVQKLFAWRCGSALSAPRHENIRRAAEFTRKLLNTSLGNVRAHKWQRNLAAHGQIHVMANQQARLRPPMFDFAGHERMQAKGNEFENGMDATQIDAATETIRFDGDCLRKVAHCIWSLLEWKQDPSEFLGRANELARDLKLQTIRLRDPRAAPLRKRKR